MKKQVIRLTESDLHQIIRNSVAKIIRENQEDEFNFFGKGKSIEYASPNSTSNYQKNYKGKVVDNCDGTYNDINNYSKDEKLHEGFGNWARNAALATSMALSPMNGQAQEINSPRVETVLDREEVNYIVSEINKNTAQNKEVIRGAEQLMQQDESVADDIYGFAMMDAQDNFITLDNKSIRNLTTDNYNMLSRAMEEDSLVKITFFDNGRRIPNVIVPLSALEKLVERY